MSQPQPGDTRIVDQPGLVRRTLKGVTKFNPGGVFKVLQTYQETGRLKGPNADYVTYQWVDTEFVEE